MTEAPAFTELPYGFHVEWSPVLRRPWRIIAPDGSCVKRDATNRYSYGFNTADDAFKWASRNTSRLLALVTDKREGTMPAKTEKEPRPRPTLTRVQFKVLDAMTGGAAIIGWRVNSALSYHYKIEEGDDISDEMLARLVTMRCIDGKVDEPGLAPRLRFTLTDTGRAKVEQNRKAFAPTRNRNGSR